MSDVTGPRKALEREVHVWLTRPDALSEPALRRCSATLSPEERARMQRFRREASQRLFLVSHALVRSSLSRYDDVRPEVWRFSKGQHGRPEIAQPETRPRLRFNLSHTAGLAACVVCLEWDCGVDIERMGRVKNLPAVARRVFTESERADLDSLSGDARQSRFTDYWALKEAYIKARGMGFHLAPRRFSIQIENSGEVGIVFGDDMADQRADDWQFELQRVGEGMRLAVALLHRADPVRRVVVREASPCANT